MSELKKKAIVVMLPTESNSFICLKENLLINANDGGCKLGYNPPNWLTQHIYICSADEIKEGDWVTNGTQIAQVNCLTIDDPNKHLHSKVIASTDPSLNLPTASEAFIQKYIEKYNAGTTITDVMVEYEVVFLPANALPSQQQHVEQPKLRNNELIVTKVKDSWSRDEVIAVHIEIMKLGLIHEQRWKDGYEPKIREVANSYFEQNL